MSDSISSNPEIVSCDPVPGYVPWVGHYVAQLNEVRHDLKAEVEGLGITQLDWHPDEETESIGTQLLHLDAIEWSWMHEDLQGISEDNYPGSWQEALPIRLGIPQVKGRALQWYLGKLDATRELTLGILENLTEDDQYRLVGGAELAEGHEPPNRLFTVDWIIWHVLEHEAAHLGQIELLRRLGPRGEA